MVKGTIIVDTLLRPIIFYIVLKNTPFLYCYLGHKQDRSQARQPKERPCTKEEDCSYYTKIRSSMDALKSYKRNISILLLNKVRIILALLLF